MESPAQRSGVTVPVWALSHDDALRTLASTRKGLSEHEVMHRRRLYGENSIPREKKMDAATILVRQFSSPLVFILIAAAGLTAFLNEWLETSIILIAVFVNAGLGFYQEYSAEQVLDKLNTYIRERARVIRGGTQQEVDSTLLVPGDIIQLHAGLRVPADARLLSVNGLSVDESILTGESLPIQKNTSISSEGVLLAERLNMVFAGTSVIEGTAEAVVSATDSHTELGTIAKLVAKTEPEPTPLQKALSQLAWFIFGITLAVVVVIFALGVARGESLVEMILISTAVSVGAIPEALPIALTVILAIGLQRLAQKKGVMRSLAAAETLGSTTIIMTDKTGTLTQAKIKLTSIHTLEEMAEPTVAQEDEDRVSDDEKSILEAALAGTYVVIENTHLAPERWSYSGHPLETSIVRSAVHHGIDVERYLSTTRTPLLAFSSVHKFSISAHHAEDSYVALGAPDILLQRSRMSKKKYIAAEAMLQRISAEGKRIVGVARLPKKAHPSLKKRSALESDAASLTFLGVLVFEDPIRPEARASLQKIHSLGATVVMVTGDLKGTALSVAHRLGWDVNEGQVLTGEELHRLSDDELLATLRNIRIFSRVTPEDKLRIGMLYKKLGEVVAMTGDGVNDAPSLKAVDIGVAIGSGSDVAKASADLILLDDNFKTIVAAIEEGRRILDNIRKTTVYLLSTSLNEVILIGGALVVGLPLPLSALQIIWVNLFTESLPALAYAFDQEYDSKRSLKAAGGILNREVKILTIGIGTIVSCMLFGLYWILIDVGVPLTEAQSTVFLCLASYILAIAFSLRSLRKPLFSYPLFGNRVLNFSVAVAALFIAFTMTTPFMQDIFNLVVPSSWLLLVVGCWLCINISLIEITKWFFRTFFREA